MRFRNINNPKFVLTLLKAENRNGKKGVGKFSNIGL